MKVKTGYLVYTQLIFCYTGFWLYAMTNLIHGLIEKMGLWLHFQIPTCFLIINIMWSYSAAMSQFFIKFMTNDMFVFILNYLS